MATNTTAESANINASVDFPELNISQSKRPLFAPRDANSNIKPSKTYRATIHMLSKTCNATPSPERAAETTYNSDLANHE